MSFTHTYTGKVLIAIDTFVAALIWRDTSITISSYTGLALKKQAPPRWAILLGWVLNHLEANHCTLAIADDLSRAQAAIQILEGK